MTQFDPSAPRRVLLDAVASGACPAAVVETGSATAAEWAEAVGRLTFDEGAPPATLDTVFDLASLTKVIATAPLAMRAAAENRLPLDARVASHSTPWGDGPARASVTIRDLLSHCSGLTGWLPLYRDHRGRAEFESTIGQLPLEYPPRTVSVYSDLGFILLGFLLADAYRATLETQFARLVADALGGAELTYLPPPEWRRRTAPTEVDTWRGRLLQGEVHDENAFALGGVAAHAGVFGTAAAVGAYARLVLRVLAGSDEANPWMAPALAREFVARRDGIPGSSRALAWDTTRPTSSCGTHLSEAAFGHTGFTGTSLWIDPARGRYIVLLTNRVHPTRENQAILHVRPALHDAIAEQWEM